MEDQAAQPEPPIKPVLQPLKSTSPSRSNPKLVSQTQSFASEGGDSFASTPDSLSPTSPMTPSPKKGKKADREVHIGTPVKEGHVNYMMMYDMLTGIRISVSRCSAKPMRELVPSDFTAAHKLAFDVTGNEMTPSSRYDFKFKDYAPWVFRMIRDCFHVDAADYLLSLTGKYVLSEIGSSGKSGSFFYYSQDYRFIIKTIHRAEHDFLLKILDKYFLHIQNNPNTLLSRIFGLHRVKLPGKRKIHFVVMGNVFPANKDIHATYDLKGSLVGRILPEGKEKDPLAVMKDLNWLNNNAKLRLGPHKRKIFESQMIADVLIMDYSLLIGVHNVNRGNGENIRDQTLSVFEPTSDTLTRRATRNIKKQGSSVASEIVPLGPSTSKLPDSIPPERRDFTFYAEDGGFFASDKNDEQYPEIYYIGIIDIFTFYSPIKRFETIFRSIGNDRKLISAVKPSFYGSRFIKFMQEAIEANAEPLAFIRPTKSFYNTRPTSAGKMKLLTEASGVNQDQSEMVDQVVSTPLAKKEDDKAIPASNIISEVSGSSGSSSYERVDVTEFNATMAIALASSNIEKSKPTVDVDPLSQNTELPNGQLTSKLENETTESQPERIIEESSSVAERVSTHSSSKQENAAMHQEAVISA